MFNKCCPKEVLSLMLSQRCEAQFTGMDMPLFTFSETASRFHTNDIFLAS